MSHHPYNIAESKALSGALYIRATGMIEFDVNSASVNETYCKVMADGDKDATVGGFAIDTRKGAFRKLVPPEQKLAALALFR